MRDEGTPLFGDIKDPTSIVFKKSETFFFLNSEQISVWRGHLND
jgi:hypothetical protein